MKTTFLIIASFLLVGCGITEITPKTKMIEYKGSNPFTDDSYSFGKIWSEDKTLHIEVNQQAGFRLYEIKPIVFEKEIYLKTYHISSGGTGTEIFDIDLSTFDLEDDWNQKVYLIIKASGNPLIPGIDSIKRKKLTVAIKGEQRN